MCPHCFVDVISFVKFVLIDYLMQWLKLFSLYETNISIYTTVKALSTNFTLFSVLT